MPTSKLNRIVIEAAIVGFEHRKTEIDAQIGELRQMLDGGPAETAATPEAAPGKRKKFSAASRRRMAEAQRLRWSKIKSESEPAAPAPKPKRKFSAAGRAAIIAANKKMWARRRAAAKSAATKKEAPARKKAVKKVAAAKKSAPAAAPTA